LGRDLEDELAATAELLDETPSEFIRAAVRERVERVAATSSREQLRSYIGVIRTDAGSNARHSGRAFKKLLAARAKSA